MPGFEDQLVGVKAGAEKTITVIDETNTRIDIAGLLAQFKRQDNFGMIALVGVQTNQYPRALDIARTFRDAGLPVSIG
ncbi:radical SAM protein, partial [Rhizobium ruizarguesonis]